MNELEKMLSDELSTVERGIAAPGVDSAGLAAAGRRERRRRNGFVAVAGAAAAVLVTVGALAAVPSLTRGSAEPPPAGSPPVPAVSAPVSLDDLPVGAASNAPYVVGSVLHAGEASVQLGRGTEFDIHYVDGTTTAVVEKDGRWKVVMAAFGEPFVVLATAQSTNGSIPLTALPSAEGAYVAVARRQGPAEVEVSLYFRGRGEGRLLGSHTYRGAGADESFGLVNATLDGRVLVSAGTYSIWSPGQQPVEVTGLGGVATDQVSYPAGAATDIGFDGSPASYGTISADGRFEALGGLPVDTVSWEASGARWVHDLGSGPVVAGADVAPTALPLPTDLDWQTVGWESDTDVIVESLGDNDDPDTQARCDVVALTCEQVPLGD